MGKCLTPLPSDAIAKFLTLFAALLAGLVCEARTPTLLLFASNRQGLPYAGNTLAWQIVLSTNESFPCELAVGDKLYCGDESLDHPRAVVTSRSSSHTVLLTHVDIETNDPNVTYDAVFRAISILWSNCSSSVVRSRHGSCASPARLININVDDKHHAGRWLCTPFGICGIVRIQRDFLDFAVTSHEDWQSPIHSRLALDINPRASGDTFSVVEESIIFAELGDAANEQAAAEAAMGTELLSSAAGLPGKLTALRLRRTK
jgi:hypothetical protein